MSERNTAKPERLGRGETTTLDMDRICTLDLEPILLEVGTILVAIHMSEFIL